MPYYYLAECLSELDQLAYLIKKLEISGRPLPVLPDESFVKEEICRIQARASMDILIFGSHAEIYFRKNMTDINRMILKLLEMLCGLPQLFYMDDMQRYRHQYGMFLKEELYKLSFFFIQLKEAHSGQDDMDQ